MKNKTGIIIAAAFIGPGTVTTASLAGAQTGLHLVWALLFSVLATILLQDMAVRLGLATRNGLSHAILSVFSSKWLKVLIGLLVFAAIGIGNAAYQSGNLMGAGLGLSASGYGSLPLWAGIMGGIALLLLFSGSYKAVERVLIALVLLMSAVFIITLFFASPDWSALFKQATSPFFSGLSFSLILALIGTTIVPYNLFLQASLTAQMNTSSTPLSDQNIAQVRRENSIAIAMGGLVTLVVMSTAAVTFFMHNKTLDASNISMQLTPVLGEHAALFFGIGLFAAGLTSAITAPLAAGYAITSLLGWRSNMQSIGFRSIVTSVVLIGATFAAFGNKPLTLIIIAQITNALLLPLIVGILIWVMNRHTGLGTLANSRVVNVLAGACFLFITALALNKLVSFL